MLSSRSPVSLFLQVTHEARRPEVGCPRQEDACHGTSLNVPAARCMLLAVRGCSAEPKTKRHRPAQSPIRARRLQTIFGRDAPRPYGVCVESRGRAAARPYLDSSQRHRNLVPFVLSRSAAQLLYILASMSFPALEGNSFSKACLPQSGRPSLERMLM